MKNVLFLLLCGIALNLCGQTGFFVGYNAGYFLYPLANSEILAHLMNNDHPDASKPLTNIGRYYHGLSYGYRIEVGGIFGIETKYAGKHLSNWGKTDTSEYGLGHRISGWGLAADFTLGKKIIIGAEVEHARFTVKWKTSGQYHWAHHFMPGYALPSAYRAPTGGFGVTTNLSFTPYIMLKLNNNNNIKLFAQIFREPHNFDDWYYAANKAYHYLEPEDLVPGEGELRYLLTNVGFSYYHYFGKMAKEGRHYF